LSLVYGGLVKVRSTLYDSGLLHSGHPGRPVIVIGNVVAGGSGKTPIVMALVRHLQALGWRPGVISRGYGRTSQGCLLVDATSRPAEVGDEPLLIARQCSVPVCVSSNRLEAAQQLLKHHPATDVLIADDGLQHRALQRDLEVCVFNAQGVGNGFLLPAGPLREPWPRSVDWVLHTGLPPVVGTSIPSYPVQRQLASHVITSTGEKIALESLRGQPLHAVAAIGQPGAFFGMLEQAGLSLSHKEALPDHYDFDSWSRSSHERLRLICTEKDAVKIWKAHPDALAVPLEITLAQDFVRDVDARLRAIAAPLSSPDLPGYAPSRTE
jgi:tetraacyldisaccharide 4'-kinase